MRRVDGRLLPPDAGDVAAFHHLAGAGPGQRPCRGLACFVARPAGSDAPWLDPDPSGARPVYCLGGCHAAPRIGTDVPRPAVGIFSRAPVVLGRVASGGAPDLATARGRDAYRGLEAALARWPEDVLDEVTRSGLRGRGGAGYPTGRKWRAAWRAAGPSRCVVCNLDEGDPGAYVDRLLAEEDPHALIEGLLIAAYAVGADRGWFYVRSEYPRAAGRLEAALAEARAAGWVGDDIGGSGMTCHLEIRRGHGSYVCGEETALIHSLEGRRPVVRARPPFPTDHGYLGRPTVVNNAETLANLPWILRHGADAFAELGIEESRGTKVVSLNSLFRRPGLYEVDLGTPVRRIVEDLGGGLRAGALRGVLIGGPLAGILPPALLDTPLGFRELQAVGAGVGHGGVVAFDEATPLPALAEAVFAFGADESCGECTPCRLGAREVRELLARRRAGRGGGVADRQVWDRVTRLLRQTSLCGLGGGLGEFAASVDRHYPEEWNAWWS